MVFVSLRSSFLTPPLYVLLIDRLLCNGELAHRGGDGWGPSAGGRKPPQPGAEERQHLQAHHPSDRQAQSRLHPHRRLQPG